jgi:hypothetical protein
VKLFLPISILPFFPFPLHNEKFRCSSGFQIKGDSVRLSDRPDSQHSFAEGVFQDEHKILLLPVL